MLFNSYIFIFGFLPIVLLGYYLIPNKRLQLGFLLIASLGFYSYWSAKLVFFLIFTVILDFYIARAIHRSKTQGSKNFYLLFSLFANLSILFFFKYYNLLASSVNSVLTMTHGDSSTLPILNVILPIGISFYTFQSMSYVIDVYRGTSDVHADLLAFAGYVTLFPHQISGPLVRHNQIVPQLENPKTYFFQTDNFWRGICFFICGLSKKVLIADSLALVVTPIVNNIAVASNTEAWLAILGYTTQLYFDFSGYSDMAVGLGLMMNIQFPQNFNSPYKSASITEFWQRWHMTLSSWLRDYLYISLGGNRSGRLSTYRNLLLTMIIGGLWHGGNWTFAAWGLFHGLLLALERFGKDSKLYEKHGAFLKNRTLQIGLTFFLVNLGWVFFRAPTFTAAGLWFQKIFICNSNISWDLRFVAEKYRARFFAALIIGLVMAFYAKNTWQFKFKTNFIVAGGFALLFVLCLMLMSADSPFLYFQF